MSSNAPFPALIMEAEAKRHAEVARVNLASAGRSEKVDVRLGRGIVGLEILAAEGGAPYDLVFIDSDKLSNAEYFAGALRLARSGTLIIVDYVVRNGTVLDESGRDSAVIGVRRPVELVGGKSLADATMMQTVGEKGHDGLLIARVR